MVAWCKLSNICGRFLLVWTLTAFSVACDAQVADPQPSPELSNSAGPSRVDRAPNVLLVVVDDMGYSDLGSFGGEIQTPTLDRFAFEGLRFTNFHATPMCATTRAALLTGRDPHFAGIRGVDDHEHLNDRVTSLASRLQSRGYHTSISGKWHLGRSEEHAPAHYGFKRSFALMSPGANHFTGGAFHPLFPSDYTEDGRRVSPPEGEYSTDFYTRRAMDYIDEAVRLQKPFFSYLAYTAPHAPLQAPASLITRYRGQYDAGYEAIRDERLVRMRRLGVLNSPLPDQYVSPPNLIPWSSLTADERRIEARKMEVYAAMIEAIDRGFKRLIDHLSEIGELEHTVIIFFSDNGANGGNPLNSPRIDWGSIEFDNTLDNIGAPSSNPFLGTGWAAATSAPFRLFKWFTSEGGIRTPAFVWGPKWVARSGVSQQYVSVTDIYPTVLSMTPSVGADNGSSLNIAGPTPAQSWLPYLSGQSETVYGSEIAGGWAYNGNKAARLGNWKALNMPSPNGSGQWQLYDLASDPGEVEDMAHAHPEVLERLLVQWRRYAQTNGVEL